MVVFLLISICGMLRVRGQYSAEQPPGYCASYLNRFTSENQCVYSFVVPKKDRDQCPGIEANVDDIKKSMDDMERKVAEVKAMIALMQSNEESWRKIGSLEGKMSELESTKITLGWNLRK